MEENLDILLKNCPKRERNHYEEENEGFLKLYADFLSSFEQPILWDQIESYPLLLDYNLLMPVETTKIRVFLQKLVVIKLNGGLGTRMRCSGPKSLIPVRSDLNFLDLTVQQIENLNAGYNTNVPLVLMNSFNTEYETEIMLKKYKDTNIKIHTFQQSRYPRISEDKYDLLCSSYDDENDAVWYPPGHGNFYESFVRSGLLDEFISAGKEYCFVSNIDNLGATVDFQLLELMTTKRDGVLPEFLMEVTTKTAADIKGGTLIKYLGKLKVLEIAQVPKEHVEEFKFARKFSMFNTNNLWMRLEAIKRLVVDRSLSLDVIPNRKNITVDNKKVDIIQLETAVGAAIGCFEVALAIMVPRSRFLPVKTTSDLFLVKSDVYVNNNGRLVINPDRPFNDVPIISLSDEHFGDYRELDKRFEKMPKCLQLHHLTVCGNVYFAKDVTFKGNVTIVAQSGGRIDIPRGSVLQSKIVTGSLRIVDF